MPRKIERIHIMQCSTQGGDNRDALREDVTDAFKRDPDVVCFTELGQRENFNAVREIARNRHYRMYQGGDDCAIAVRQDRGEIRFKDGGYVRVHGGQDKPEHLGGRFGEKGVTWARINFFGVDCYVHTAHWVHNQTDDVTGKNVKRAKMISEKVAELVRRHGAKGSIAFFTGDMNVDPDQSIYPHRIFTRNKLVTIWEDAGQRPTHGSRSIDVIGRYGADKRVDFVRYTTHPARSDHRQVSAHYDVQVDRYAPQDHPPAGDPDDPDGPIITAGNRSWKDYTEQELYDLPQAVDDSDTENG